MSETYSFISRDHIERVALCIGSEALERLAAHPDIALLFVDVVMPGVNGRELAEEALRRRPDLKVLFTSGYTRKPSSITVSSIQP